MLLTTALIVYGSLYPWHFVDLAGRDAPLTVLADSLGAPIRRLYFLRDLIVNIAIYVPFGLTAYFALERWRRGELFAAPVAAGCILSIGVELAQLFTPTRTPSLFDVIFNTIGSGIGVATASSLRAYLPRSRRPLMQRDAAATALLCCWAAYLFFPFLPMLSRILLGRKINVLVNSSIADPVPFVSAAAAWFIVGGLLVRAGAVWPRALLGLTVIAIPTQLFVYSRQPVLAELAGAAVGSAAFLLVGPSRIAAWVNASVALGTVIVRECAPFDWQRTANAFTWLPFGGLLEADWQYGVLILIEKAFYYGIAVWTLRETGVWLAVPALAVLVVCLEFSQIYLPGRTPDITDVVIVLIADFALSLSAPLREDEE